MSFPVDPGLAEEHRRWLSNFDRQHLLDWEGLVGHDWEAGMCEAAVRRVLQHNGNVVYPNRILAGGEPSPDFRCDQAGQTFFVEVTCISREVATAKTGLSDKPDEFAGYLLNDALWGACKGKTKQCGIANGPALVAVGTFHATASEISFGDVELESLLTGDVLYTRDYDDRLNPVGESYLVTTSRSAAFFSPDRKSIAKLVRQPISGMLVCGFGCDPLQVRGILHPKPRYTFDRRLLPGIEFCRLKEGWEHGRLSVEWI